MQEDTFFYIFRCTEYATARNYLFNEMKIWKNKVLFKTSIEKDINGYEKYFVKNVDDRNKFIYTQTAEYVFNVFDHIHKIFPSPFQS